MVGILKKENYDHICQWMRGSFTSITCIHTRCAKRTHFRKFSMACRRSQRRPRGRVREAYAQSYTLFGISVAVVVVVVRFNSLLWHFKCTRHNMTCLCGVMFSFAAVVHNLFLCRCVHDRVREPTCAHKLRPRDLCRSLNVIKCVCALHMFARCSACSELANNTFIIKISVYVARSMFLILFGSATQNQAHFLKKNEIVWGSLAPHISFWILICCNFITVKPYFKHFYGRRLSSPSTSLSLSRAIGA